MWAKPALTGLCAASAAGGQRLQLPPSPHSEALTRGGPCNSECGYKWLNASGLGHYYFGHKLPRSWLNMLRLHACYPNASRTGVGQQVLKRLIGGGRFDCTCIVGEAAPSMRSAAPVHDDRSFT